MTEQRRAKQEIRARMAQTGEKYTQARRAVLAPGDAGEPPVPPRPPFIAQDEGEGGGDPGLVGWFTDQAYNLVLLAQDEARMLGRAQVAPEHLLLAVARRGNAVGLLATLGVDAGAIHAAIVRRDGLGTDLVLGVVALAPDADAVLCHAIDAAHARGITAPSSEHLLLGVQSDAGAAMLLRGLGVADVTPVVDAKHRVTRPPLPLPLLPIAQTRQPGPRRTPPRPGPIPPVFERFDETARATVADAVSIADGLRAGYVLPAHLTLAALRSPESVVAQVRTRYAGQFAAAADVVARLLSQARQAQPTKIFSDSARRLVAQDVLAVARRLGDARLRSAHLLLALIDDDAADETVIAARSVLDTAQISVELADGLRALQSRG